MSMKLKVLGMGLLAVLAMSAFAVVNAGAESPEYFHTDSPDEHTILDASEGGTHNLHFRRTATTALNEYIGCTEESYEGTTTANTFTSLTVKASYAKCHTTNEAKTEVTIDVNSCVFTFTNTANATHDPVHLICNAGDSIKITHPNCTITVHPQTVPNAVDYTTKENGDGLTHGITLDVTAKFNATYHGLCQFIVPTNSTGELVGSVTVTGTDTDENYVNVTAT